MNEQERLELFKLKAGKLIEIIDNLDAKVAAFEDGYPAAILPPCEDGCTSSNMALVETLDGGYCLAHYHRGRGWLRHPDLAEVAAAWWWPVGGKK